MILVDTSVWVDHLRRPDEQLRRVLEQELVLTHPLVIAEVALGSIPNRREVLAALSLLEFARDAADGDVLTLIEARELWSKGLSTVDAQLLASALVTPETRLWTRDKRLAAAAGQLGVGWSPS